MKKKIKRYVPVICLLSGWAMGLLIFYLSSLFKAPMPAYGAWEPTFFGVCSAVWTQLKLFAVICLFGFSMLSGIVPVAVVFVRSALASFSCALVYGEFSLGRILVWQYVAFTLCSALICVFLTSSARLAHIFYTKVPHTGLQNILDYVARQLFTMGFATAVLTIYFTVLAVL